MLVTLKQIATAAQTDTGTVSRVLSGGYRRARISEERAREIRAIADQLKWRPNVAARTTRTGRFNSIALVSSSKPGLVHYLPQGFLSAVHDEAHQRDHMVNLVRLSPGQIDGTERAKVLEEISVDGWLLNFNMALPASLMEQIRALRIQTVLINNIAPEDAVRPDDLDAARQMTSRLVQAGRHRIAFFDSESGADAVAAGISHYSVKDRQGGYEAVMREAGLEPIVIRPETSVSRRDAMSYAAKAVDFSAVDAVVTYNPGQAQVLMMLAERQGRRVPEDLLMGTFHESPIGDMGLPIITAAMRWDLLAQTAVGLLMGKIEQQAGPVPSREIRYEVSIPATVAAIEPRLVQETAET